MKKTPQDSAFAQLDLGPVTRGAIKLIVSRRGADPLFIVASSGAPGQMHEAGWTRVL